MMSYEGVTKKIDQGKLDNLKTTVRYLVLKMRSSKEETQFLSRLRLLGSKKSEASFSCLSQPSEQYLKVITLNNKLPSLEANPALFLWSM